MIRLALAPRAPCAEGRSVGFHNPSPKTPHLGWLGKDTCIDERNRDLRTPLVFVQDIGSPVLIRLSDSMDTWR